MSAITTATLLVLVFATRTGLAATSLGCQTEMAGNSARTAMDMPMPDDGAPSDHQQPCDEPVAPSGCDMLAPCTTSVLTPSTEAIAFVEPAHASRLPDQLIVPASVHVRPALPPPRA